MYQGSGYFPSSIGGSPMAGNVFIGGLMPCPICWCSLGHLPECPDYDDRYQDELEEELSDCCSAEILAEDICSRCKEHCGVEGE